jgi:hypothetical protein
MYAASYLMNAPGTQQLLQWGGAQARELVGHTVGLLADQQRLGDAGAAWQASGRDLHRGADELRTGLAALSQPADRGGSGWDGAAAEGFRTDHGARIDQLTALGDQHKAIGDTLVAAAEQAGRVHNVLLAGTHAAGEAVRLLAAGSGEPGGPAASVAAGWLQTGSALLAAWAEHADHAATMLGALRPSSPAG